MLNLDARIAYLQNLFTRLEATPGRNGKERLVRQAHEYDEQLSKDLTYALEILDGRHKLGFTFVSTVSRASYDYPKECTLERYLSKLYSRCSKTEENIHYLCAHFWEHTAFVGSLVNREWKLGIGKSQLKATTTSPMLAKKFDPDKVPNSKQGYYITEKLDGNRCIAKYEECEHPEQDCICGWYFYSRSGRKLNVDFDMSNLPTDCVFDGEILSRDQWEGRDKSQSAFNTTSGKVNSKRGDKSDLVYVIFDMVKNYSYMQRRMHLDHFADGTSNYPLHSENVAILPVIAWFKDKKSLGEELQTHFSIIRAQNGEGLMVNIGDRPYEQKRTDALLKVKETYSMDMYVTGVSEGTGKHEGVVGSLHCEVLADLEANQHKTYRCSVGSGLSDMQRAQWANDARQIIGKIVEVEYFSISQDKNAVGTDEYSLRFPRLKRVRNDKSDTSVD